MPADPCLRNASPDALLPMRSYNTFAKCPASEGARFSLAGAEHAGKRRAIYRSRDRHAGTWAQSPTQLQSTSARAHTHTHICAVAAELVGACDGSREGGLGKMISGMCSMGGRVVHPTLNIDTRPSTPNPRP